MTEKTIIKCISQKNSQQKFTKKFYEWIFHIRYPRSYFSEYFFFFVNPSSQWISLGTLVFINQVHLFKLHIYTEF